MKSYRELLERSANTAPANVSALIVTMLRDGQQGPRRAALADIDQALSRKPSDTPNPLPTFGRQSPE